MADDETPTWGSDQSAVPPPLPDIANNAVELLTTADICFNGWEHSIAAKKSYYVRGATWFHNNVMSPISGLQSRASEDFNPIFARLPRFRDLNLAWDQTFSPRQAMAALSLRSRTPVKFHKAVQTILLCDQIVRERVKSGQAQVAADEALRRMRIEPAVFFVQDFDADLLEELKKREPQILDRLRSMTGQRTRVVFGEMSMGHTVTKPLAQLTRDALIELFKGTEIGAVDCGLRHGVALAAAPTEALAD